MSAPDAPTLPDFEPGDVVLIENVASLDIGGDLKSGIVTKAGPKWYTVKRFDKEFRYDRETGCQEFLAPTKIVTDEIIKYRQRRKEATERLNELYKKAYWTDWLTLDQMDRMITIIEENGHPQIVPRRGRGKARKKNRSTLDATV